MKITKQPTYIAVHYTPFLLFRNVQNLQNLQMYKFGCSQYKCFLNAFFSYQKCIRWRYEGLQDEVSAIILFSNIFLFHFLQHFLYAFTNDIQCPLKFTHFYTHRKLYTRGSNSCTSHFFDVTILTAGYKI